MSAQLAIAFVQVPRSKFGHWPMFQPMSPSGGSLPFASAVPHVLSLPPQPLTIASRSFVRDLVSTPAVFPSVRQSVSAGSLCLTIASRHFCSVFASAWTKPLPALTIAARHLLAAFTAGDTARAAPVNATVRVGKIHPNDNAPRTATVTANLDVLTIIPRAKSNAPSATDGVCTDSSTILDRGSTEISPVCAVLLSSLSFL